MAGMAAILMVLRRPMRSIIMPDDIEAIGPISTITEAIHDDSSSVTLRSLSGRSTCGMKNAEKLKAIPMTM